MKRERVLAVAIIVLLVLFYWWVYPKICDTIVRHYYYLEKVGYEVDKTGGVQALR